MFSVRKYIHNEEGRLMKAIDILKYLLVVTERQILAEIINKIVSQH